MAVAFSTPPLLASRVLGAVLSSDPLVERGTVHVLVISGPSGARAASERCVGRSQVAHGRRMCCGAGSSGYKQQQSRGTLEHSDVGEGHAAHPFLRQSNCFSALRGQ